MYTGRRSASAVIANLRVRGRDWTALATCIGALWTVMLADTGFT